MKPSSLDFSIGISIGPPWPFPPQKIGGIKNLRLSQEGSVGTRRSNYLNKREYYCIAFRERRFVGAQTSSNAFCTVKSHGVGRQAWHWQAEKSGVERSVTAGPEPGRASSEQRGHLSARNAFRRRRILPQRGSAVAICGGCAQEPFRETTTAEQQQRREQRRRCRCRWRREI